MKNLFYMIKANIFKMLHSKLLYLHLIIPVVGVTVFTAYYSYSPWKEEAKVLIYLQAVAMAFPLMISIATTMMYEQEQKAGNFQNILSVPYAKVIAHWGNLLTLCLFGLLASILTILGFGGLFRIMGFDKFSILIYFKLVLVMFLSNVTLYVLQYIICFTWGNGISLSFGILGTLLSPLLYLGLGDFIWSYIPCGYAIRISTYYFNQYVDLNLFHVILPDLKRGIMTIGIITIIILIYFVGWSNRWQGEYAKSE